MRFGKLMFLITCFVLCYLADSSNGFSLSSNSYAKTENSSLIRLRRQNRNSCNDGFQCKTTQQCIDVDKQCDGALDCSDGSDEFESLCKQQVCPGYLFRCDYGACLSSDKQCNGVKDCKDNSDEVGCSSVPKVNTYCRSDQFECSNGQCVSADSRCNGVTECDDRSDETEELCLNIYCPGYTYKCAYGACVDGDSRCNGVQNCVDNSDEADCEVVPTPVPPTKPTKSPPSGSGTTCVTPAQPENGRWVYASNQQAGNAGERVGINSIINFSCNSGYRLSTTEKDIELVVCLEKGNWLFKDMPYCQKLCPPLYNSPTITMGCKNIESGTPVTCDRATSGVILSYKCAPFYEATNPTTVNCRDGTWDYSPSCIPVCGEKRVTANTLIVNGRNVERGNYPWMVAIYRLDEDSNTYINVCGGSLLRPNIVLTAAHCVTRNKDGKIANKNLFQIAAGKYYNRYKDSRDLDTAQYKEVDLIETNNEYKGELRNFRGDIAILKLKSPFALSPVIQPICYLNVNEFSLSLNAQGVVTGWGFTKSGSDVADKLKEIELPYKDDNTCQSEFDEEWAAKYFAGDKLCAGYFNQSTSVCKGDSGGALAFKHPTSKRYFVHGIVSIGPSFINNQITHCDIQQNALFTKVTFYFEWLQSRISFLTKDSS